ncbi:MAG TPA: hypothetical protein VKE24_14005, partial [Candidatus Acidoferrales bacterium]|nr:hypothetical protein [Candidatus Acidoferrales bacterium]
MDSGTNQPGGSEKQSGVGAGMAGPVRVALLGYGYWGPNYARIFSELPGSEMATICEPALERRQRARSRYPQVKSTSDAQEVLGR